MKEIITLQLGQCGNQIGLRYWDVLRREHEVCKGGEEGRDSFFSTSKEGTTRARALLIDSEEGVVSQVMRGPMRAYFDPLNIITDVSGAGNNWAHGYSVYGPHHGPGILDRVRACLEACESPQAFVFLHSAGGGTGSGLGSYILEHVADAFPEPYRFAASLLPSDTDDVITSPYNALLSTSRLVEFADVVFPVENQALLDIVTAQSKGGGGGVGVGVGGGVISRRAPVPALPQPSNSHQQKYAPAALAASPAQKSATATATTATAASSPPPSALQSLLDVADTVLQAATLHPTPSQTMGGSKGGRQLGQQQQQPSSSSTGARGVVVGGKGRISVGGVNPGGAGARPVQRPSRVGGVTLGGSRAAGGGGAVSARNSIGQRLTGLGGGSGGAGLGGVGRPAVKPLDRDNHLIHSASNTTSSSSIRDIETAVAAAAAAVDPSSNEQLGGGGGREEGGEEGPNAPSSPAQKPNSATGRNGTAWDSMNDLVARMLSDLTSSMRFKGTLNMDLNEVATTLVPFPKLHFLSTSMSPLRAPREPHPQSLDVLVAEALSKCNMLVKGNLRGGTHLACGVVLRGRSIAVSEVVGSVRRLGGGEVPLVPWNPDGFKVAVCSQPSHYAPTTALLLSNNKGMAGNLGALYSRFLSLYRVRAHLHHYLEYIEGGTFLEAAEAVDGVVKGYEEL